MSETKVTSQAVTNAVLYSFRRCPYAMRARMAIAITGIIVELREVVLRDKPAEMLAISEKATVPILQVDSDYIIDESLDIMKWGLQHNDPDQWLPNNSQTQAVSDELIQYNDQQFKPWLDRYKYADRHPEHSKTYYRKQSEVFLRILEDRLNEHSGLIDDQVRLADIAIFPFIRQFAHVDSVWFDNSEYSNLRQWYQFHHNSTLFQSIMKKYPQWHPNDEITIFPEASAA